MCTNEPSALARGGHLRDLARKGTELSLCTPPPPTPTRAAPTSSLGHWYPPYSAALAWPAASASSPSSAGKPECQALIKRNMGTASGRLRPPQAWAPPLVSSTQPGTGRGQWPCIPTSDVSSLQAAGWPHRLLPKKPRMTPQALCPEDPGHRSSSHSRLYPSLWARSGQPASTYPPIQHGACAESPGREGQCPPLSPAVLVRLDIRR